MKKITAFVFFFLLLISTLVAQETRSVPSFLNIKWGSSQEDANRAMLAKNLTPENEGRNHPAYIGIFAGRRSTILCYFQDDRFTSAFVFLLPKKDLDSDYWELSGGIQNKYGSPNRNLFVTSHAAWDFEKNGAISIHKLADLICIGYYDGITTHPYEKEPQALLNEVELSDL